MHPGPEHAPCILYRNELKCGVFDIVLLVVLSESIYIHGSPEPSQYRRVTRVNCSLKYKELRVGTCFAIASGVQEHKARTSSIISQIGRRLPGPSVDPLLAGCDMPTFEILVVGSGGGPDDTNLSGYLLKSLDSPWVDGIIALEAGSGLGTLKKILESNPDLLRSSNLSVEGGPRLSAAQIYSGVRAFLITHAHLDHIMSLVLLAGFFTKNRVKIMSSRQILEDLESVFHPNRLWPNLASWNLDDPKYMYLYDPIEPSDGYKYVHGNVSARIMPVSHGHIHGPYLSSAFFIRHTASMQEFLFFGDVEPDDISLTPRTVHIWRAAAPMIPDKLKAIFIECSWPSGRANDQLYGHLSPEHFAQEMENLANEVAKSRSKETAAELPKDDRDGPRATKKLKTTQSVQGVLRGLRVYVIHCKEDTSGAHVRPMHEVIVDEVQALVGKKNLGVEILHAKQGSLIQI